MKKNIFMLALALAFATAGLMAQTPQAPQKKEAVKTEKKECCSEKKECCKDKKADKKECKKECSKEKKSDKKAK